MIHLLLLAAVILLVLWFLGLSSLSLGSFAWVFLIIALIAAVLWMVGGGLGSRRRI